MPMPMLTSIPMVLPQLPSHSLLGPTPTDPSALRWTPLVMKETV